MIEVLDRSLFELVADSRGRILDIDPQLVELLPPPGANYVDQIFYNFASDATHVQNVTMKTKFPYQLHAQLIPRGKIEQETVHRKWALHLRLPFPGDCPPLRQKMS